MKNADQHWMKHARLAAENSKDRSRQVGCVLVQNDQIISTGYNGFPRGCYDCGDDVPAIMEKFYNPNQGRDIDEQATALLRDAVEARHERPLKYLWTEHAERNAVYNAARRGIATHGADAYVPWFPCADCMRALIQAGIALLVCERPDFHDPKWGPDFVVAETMARESGIAIRYYKEPVRA